VAALGSRPPSNWRLTCQQLVRRWRPLLGRGARKNWAQGDAVEGPPPLTETWARPLPPSGPDRRRESRRASPATKRMRAARMWEQLRQRATMSATTRRHSRVALGPLRRRSARAPWRWPPRAPPRSPCPFMVARAPVSTPLARSVDWQDASRRQAILDPTEQGRVWGPYPIDALERLRGSSTRTRKPRSTARSSAGWTFPSCGPAHRAKGRPHAAAHPSAAEGRIRLPLRHVRRAGAAAR